MKFVIEQIPSTDSRFPFNVRVSRFADDGHVSDIWEQHRDAASFDDAAAATFAFCVAGAELTEIDFSQEDESDWLHHSQEI